MTPLGTEVRRPPYCSLLPNYCLPTTTAPTLALSANTSYLLLPAQVLRALAGVVELYIYSVFRVFWTGILLACTRSCPIPGRHCRASIVCVPQASCAVMHPPHT